MANTRLIKFAICVEEGEGERGIEFMLIGKEPFLVKTPKIFFFTFLEKKWSKKAPIHPEMASCFIFSLVVSPPRLTSRWPHREQDSNKDASSKTRTK